MTKEIYSEMLISNVLPAIRDQWPRCSAKRPIFIQQDNAKPHLSVNDPRFIEAASADGFNIRLRCQPPNSPDMNVLDLGLFNAIQALQHQNAPKNIDELIHAVNNAFAELDLKRLNYVFLTLQQCMVMTMKENGGINYKLPHMGKEKLERAGELPLVIDVDNQLVENVKAFISTQ